MQTAWTADKIWHDNTNVDRYLNLGAGDYSWSKCIGRSFFPLYPKKIKWIKTPDRRLSYTLLHPSCPRIVFAAGSGNFLTEGPGDKVAIALKAVITDSTWNKHWSKDQALFPPGSQSILNDHWLNISEKSWNSAYVYLLKQRFVAVQDRLAPFFSPASPPCICWCP